jgi:putative transposase
VALRRVKFRLYPTKKAQATLHYHLRLHQDRYNVGVYHRKIESQKFGQSINYLDQQNCLQIFKQEWTKYNLINFQALHATLKRVGFSCNSFFDHLALGVGM